MNRLLHYGWVVPFLCLYLLWNRFQRPDATRGKATQASFPSNANAAGPPAGRPRVEASTFSPSRLPVRSLYLLLLLCALAYAPTRFLHEANPIWRLTSLLLALEVIGFTLGFIRLLGGYPALRRSFFPIAFFLVAVPWPSGLESFLVQSLTRWNVSATVELLGLLGVPALQHGNVIEIGAGMVGIDEACSGIRSFQATLMVSLFLGELQLLSIGRRVLCVLAGFACSFVFNLGRTSFLTWIGATKGTPAIARWHDPAGVTILIACFVSVWLLARFLARRERDSQVPPRPAPAPDDARTANISVAGSGLHSPLYIACSLGAWLVLIEIVTEGWYRSHERASPAYAQWNLKSIAEVPSFNNVEIEHDVLVQFRADEAAHRFWLDPVGNAWQLFYFHWRPRHSLNGRVAVQLAKTHGPEKCLPRIGMALKSYLGVITVPAAHRELEFQQYLFTVDGRPLHVFYGLYEDHAGSVVPANRRKDSASRVAAALAGSRNYGQRFLEIAIAGPKEPSVARAALARSLPSLISAGE